MINIEQNTRGHKLKCSSSFNLMLGTAAHVVAESVKETIRGRQDENEKGVIDL